MHRKACRSAFPRWTWIGFIVLWALSAASLSSKATAQDLAKAQGPLAGLFRPSQPVETPYLTIEWPSSLVSQLEDRKAAVPAQLLAAKACTALGQALLVGRGEWGRGLFADFGCYLDGKAESKPFAGHGAQTDKTWFLRVVQVHDSLEMGVFYRPGGEASAEERIATVTMPATVWTQDLMREQGYANLVAALVLDSLPALRRFEAVPKGAPSSIDVALGATNLDVPKTKSLKPKQLVLFTWSFSSKNRLWMPHIVGSAKVSGLVGKERWHLSFTKPVGSRPLYAGRLSGPGSQKDKILSLLARRQKTLLTNERAAGYDEIREGVAKAGRFLLLNTVESGYVGVRVGRELIDPSSAVIPPATVIGVIGEVRSGYLAGLRVYFDYVPRHGTTYKGEDLWVEWSRLVAGYNFGVDFPWIIDRLELAPKIGVWNVNSRLPYYTVTQATGFRDFTLHNALSLGLEGAAVWERKHDLLRFWYARDVSVPLASKVASVQSTVESTRAGLDGLVKGPPIDLFGKQWRLSYLLFIYHEDLIFSQKSQQAGPFSLEFSSAYAGGGISLAW